MGNGHGTSQKQTSGLGNGLPKPFYDDGRGIVIYHGDCREILPVGEVLSADSLVICDPPYGINHESSHGASWQGTQIRNDSDTTIRGEPLRKEQTDDNLFDRAGEGVGRE